MQFPTRTRRLAPDSALQGSPAPGQNKWSGKISDLVPGGLAEARHVPFSLPGCGLFMLSAQPVQQMTQDHAHHACQRGGSGWDGGSADAVHRPVTGGCGVSIRPLMFCVHGAAVSPQDKYLGRWHRQTAMATRRHGWSWWLALPEGLEGHQGRRHQCRVGERRRLPLSIARILV